MLLGEGIEEFYFFEELLRQLGRDDVHVDHFGGKVKIREGLAAFAQRPGFSQINSLAITRDADFLKEDALGKTTANAAAFESVRSALLKASLPVPDKEAEFCSGKFAGREIRVGVYILPGAGADGMLEDLCLSAIVADPALPCIDEMFECATHQAKRACAPKDAAKARMHAWLATQVRPDLRLGEAAQEGYFDWTVPAFNSLRAFLESL